MNTGASRIGTTGAFCVGQAKSGTATLCGLLAARHRAAHEPERERILALILAESRGEIGARGVRDALVERARRLDLDYDIAWANQFIIAHLVAVFPGAKFIALVREPCSWLQSIVGHLVSRDIPPDARAFLDRWFRPDRHPHTRHDGALQRLGLYSVAAFLTAWNDHIDACTRLIPRDRLLVLRTHELNRSHRRLAEFLKIPVDSLDAGRGLLNRGAWPGQVGSLIDRAYLKEMVGTICGENLGRHFPEFADIDATVG